MGFERLNDRATCHAKDLKGVDVSLIGGQAHPVLVIRLRPDVVDRMRWSPDEYVDVLPGNGKDAGTIKLQRPKNHGSAGWGRRKLSTLNGCGLELKVSAVILRLPKADRRLSDSAGVTFSTADARFDPADQVALLVTLPEKITCLKPTERPAKSV